MNWICIDEPSAEEDFDLYWNDVFITTERFQSMKAHQKVNHFLSMFQITRKGMLAKNLNKMQKVHPMDYKFYPKTWLLPKDAKKLKQYCEQKTEKVPYFICKPDHLS